LDVILKTHGLGKEQEGSIIRVTPLERLRKERDDELQSKRVVEELEPPVTRTLQLNYARAEELQSNMEKLLSKQGRLDIDKRTNTIIIKDVSSTVDEVLSLIQRLDSQTKQVSIDTRIVETNRTFLQELGIRWGGFVTQDTGVKFPRQVDLAGRQSPTPVGGNFAVDLPTVTQPPSLALGFSLISNSSIIDLELQALERTGRGRIISNPKVVTLDNKEALIESGDEVPFKTETAESGPKVEFKDAKITLRVTPHISPDDFVLLEIDAAKKEVDFSRLVEGNPTITSRQSKTSILVKDGATAVIGGLFKRTTADTREGVPGLSKIPYLGWLFKTEQTRDDNDDLLFFITPRIVRERYEASHR
jgi:type IV pilus assembly protein PilQ